MLADMKNEASYKWNSDSHIWRLSIPTIHYINAVISRAGTLGADEKKGDCIAQALPADSDLERPATAGYSLCPSL